MEPISIIIIRCPQHYKISLKKIINHKDSLSINDIINHFLILTKIKILSKRSTTNQSKKTNYLRGMTNAHRKRPYHLSCG